MSPDFRLPLAYDLSATFLLAVSGALAGRRKGYDLVGVAALAFVTGLGGALLRDGLFLEAGAPAVLRDGRYLVAVGAGAAVAIFFSRHLHRLGLLLTLADALGLGAYAVYGTEKALDLGFPLLSAALVGTVNAVGGGLLRDVLVREEPLFFRPGEFYALAALAGIGAHLALLPAGVAPAVAGLAGVATAFAVRLLSIRLGWRTGAFDGDR